MAYFRGVLTDAKAASGASTTVTLFLFLRRQEWRSLDGRTGLNKGVRTQVDRQVFGKPPEFLNMGKKP